MPALFEYDAGMKAIQNIQYTLRGIPPAVNRFLKKKAEKEGKSLNKVIIECLIKSLNLSGETVIYHDLDDLAGTWHKDAEFDRAINDMHAIDPEIWK
jgi:hypothetical protein